MTYPDRAGRPREGQAGDELKHALEAEVLERVERGKCGCGCETDLPASRTSRTRFRDKRHRQRNHVHKLQALAKAAGVPARLNLETVQASEPTAERRNDAQDGRTRPRRAPRPGVSIYLPTVDAARMIRGHVQAYLDGIADDVVELELLVEVLDAALERRRKRDARA